MWLWGLTAHGFACQGEAQFIGLITQAIAGNQNCRLYLQLRYYRPSQVCPLYVHEIKQEGIVVPWQNCHQYVGMEVSGVVARINGQLVID